MHWMIRLKLYTIVALGSVLSAHCALAASDLPGVSVDEIRIGNTNPYSGPASSYGTIGKALAAYFNMVNEQGGVNGRNIRFITADDGYNPARTREQVRKLVEKDDVLAIFQPLGTPTNTAVHAFLNDLGVPHLFLGSGASKWGQPEEFPWTMGWQPSYRTEAQVFARYILETVDQPRIGVLYQNDDYGRDYLEGLREGLGERAPELIVAEQSYETTDPNVHAQLLNLKSANVDVLVTVATPRFVVQTIRKLAELDWQPLHILNSVTTSVGSVLEPAGLEASTGIVTALYYRDPNDPAHQQGKAYEDWLAWMENYYPEGTTKDPLNVYAYLAAQTLVQVLEQAGEDLSRENVMRQAASLRDLELGLLLPGIRINTAADDYFPIEAMQLMRFDGVSWTPIGEVVDVSN